MARIIQKGNVRSNNYYDIRITEENGDIYYYHFLNLSDGESVITSKPFNLNNLTEISWEDLPIKLKDEHYNNVYPDANYDSYEKNCFLYGKEQADEIQRALNQKEDEERQRKEIISNIRWKIWVEESEAIEIYNTIGELKVIQIVSKNCWWYEYLVNGKWIVKTRKGHLMSIEEKSDAEKQRKEWGKRVKHIASLAKTSFDMATVVGNIVDTDEAVNILKQIVKIVNSQKFYDEMKELFHVFGNIDKYYCERFFLSHLSEEQVKKLNWSRKFQNSVEKILKNK